MELKEEKDKLRNELFEKYFEVENDCIKFKDLMDKLMPFTKVWKELKNILIENSKDFDFYMSIEMLKEISNQGNNYLIIKENLWTYFIIDLEGKKVLSEKEVIEKFNDNVFINNFDEEKSNEDLIYYPEMYRFLEYSGDIEKLLDLYYKNKGILNINPHIHYRLNIDKAWTGLYINIANYAAQLHFNTPDQFLYEHLFFNGDLTPFGMQDAVTTIGLEKIQEMFTKTKEIPIPMSIIPKDYLNYILSYKEKGKILVKKNEDNN